MLPGEHLFRTGWAMATFGGLFQKITGKTKSGTWRMQLEMQHGSRFCCGEWSWHREKMVHSIRSARCLPIHGMNILTINSCRMAIRTEELWCFVPIFLRPCRILTFWRMAFIDCKMLGSWQRITICCVNIWDFKARICGQTRPPRGLWWL